MTIPNTLNAKPTRSFTLAVYGLSCLWHAPATFWRRINATDTLPHDMLDEECTVVLCFKLSVKINVYTGGLHDMTFSARCYRSSRITRNPLMRWLWIGCVAVIDVLCGMLRGEAYHCETAWRNHIAR